MIDTARPTLAKPRKILVYRLGSLGDTMAALPCLHALARAYPDAERWMLTNHPVHAKAPAASAVLGDSKLIHGYIGYPTATRSVVELVRVWWRIRRFRPELLVYLAKPRGDAAVRRDLRFFRLAGVKNFIGVPSGDRARNLPVADGKWESEAARLARCVPELGSIDLKGRRSWDLRLNAAEMETAARVLGPLEGRRFVVCGPGTKMQAKDWGMENWKELLGRLSVEMPEHRLVLIGAREDKEAAHIAGSLWTGPVLNCCGELAPRESAAVLEQAELFLGPDSGPMHFAAAVGLPCAIAFAARTKPGVWFPAGQHHRVVYHRVDCSDCNLETCVAQGKKCLTSISVDEMLKAAMEAWAAGQRRAAVHPMEERGECT